MTVARHLVLSLSGLCALGALLVLFAGRVPFTNTTPHQQLVQHDFRDDQRPETQVLKGEINLLQQHVAANQQEYLSQQVEQRRNELQLALIEADKLREQLDTLRQQRQVAEARLQQLTSGAAELEAKQTETDRCHKPLGRSPRRGSRKNQA